MDLPCLRLKTHSTFPIGTPFRISSMVLYFIGLRGSLAKNADLSSEALLGVQEDGRWGLCYCSPFLPKRHGSFLKTRISLLIDTAPLLSRTTILAIVW